jgi:hypothetical protein
MRANHIPPTAIEYHGTYEHPPADPNVYETAWFPQRDPADLERCKYWLQMNQGATTIHKTFRPSSVHPGLSDDDLQYAYSCDASAVFARYFETKYELKRIESREMRRTIKMAERFIGRKRYGPVAGAYETDMIGAYASYRSNPYYARWQMPGNVFYTADFDATRANLAFVAVRSIQAHGALARALNALYPGGPLTVLPAPLWEHLTQAGAVVDAAYGIYTDQSKDIDLLGTMDEFKVSPDDRKRIRNSMIGRCIAGGMADEYKREFHGLSKTECEQVIYECGLLGYKFQMTSPVVDRLFNSIIIMLPHVGRGLFHFHSYILAYQAISMLQRWVSLEETTPILAFNVDALVTAVEPPACAGWTVTRSKPYYEKLSLCAAPSDTYTCTSVHAAHVNSVHCTRARSTFLLGAAGVGKSYIVKTNPHPSCAYLLPTKVLRDSTRADLRATYPGALVCTAHKWFQFTQSDAGFLHIVRAQKLHRDVLYIDEATMYPRELWEVMRRRAALVGTILIPMGDFHQLRSELLGLAKGTPVDLNYFATWCEIRRVKRGATPCRHQPEYGEWLDSLRELESEELAQTVVKSQVYDTITTADQLHACAHVIIGQHKTAHVLNAEHRLRCIRLGAPFPLRRTSGVSSGVIALMPVDTPSVYWDRKSITDVPPAGTLYEPAYAVTIDSFQGRTVDTSIAVHAEGMTRPGALYTAITRTRTEAQTKLASATVIPAV